jgi:hypothetical protein
MPAAAVLISSVSVLMGYSPRQRRVVDIGNHAAFKKHAGK